MFPTFRGQFPADGKAQHFFWGVSRDQTPEVLTIISSICAAPWRVGRWIYFSPGPMICSDLKSPVDEIWRTMTGHDFYVSYRCLQGGMWPTRVHGYLSSYGLGPALQPWFTVGKSHFIICEPVNFSKTPNIGIINFSNFQWIPNIWTIFFQHLGTSTTMKIITQGKFDSSPLKNGSWETFFLLGGFFSIFSMCFKNCWFFGFPRGRLGSIDTFIWADLSSGVTGVLSVPRLKVP